jgi:hypothetical protein
MRLKATFGTIARGWYELGGNNARDGLVTVPWHHTKSFETRVCFSLKTNTVRWGHGATPLQTRGILVDLSHCATPGDMLLAIRDSGAMYYRCADGRFLMSPRGCWVSNHIHISSSKTRVNAGIRGWKLHLSKFNRCQESVGGICFTKKKRRAASLQPLTLFQTTTQMQYFQIHLLA